VTAGASPRFTLGRRSRITRGGEFVSLKQEGRRLAVGCLLANWRVVPERSVRRLGVITSSRVGGAVVRNRARRLLREVFRLHQHQLPAGLDLVLVARPSAAGKSFQQVERDFLTMTQKTGLLVSENNPG
jgi:ribonuclease P protein component